jgi:2-oxoglutarate dehydrogenase complex dehydrogenase (E1) component-like enzyme
MHISDPDRRRWIQERLERELPHTDSERVLERLIASDDAPVHLNVR